METVPKLRVVAHDEAAGIGLPDLPEEVRFVLADVAGVAREGLLAMSVAAGMAVMQAMFDAEASMIPTGLRCVTAPVGAR
jgi:hypothetical protein